MILYSLDAIRVECKDSACPAVQIPDMRPWKMVDINLCDNHGTKEDFTPPDKLQYKGVAERGLAMIETAQQAARIQAPPLFPNDCVPGTDSLWAKATKWACNSLN